MKKSLLSLLAISGLWFLNGCGGGNSITTPPPPPATHFSVTPATATPTAGTAFMVTVTALTASGQTATSYSGTLHFTSSDANAVLPADTAMNGVSGTFSVTLNTAGSQTVSVSDAGALKGTSNAVAVAGPPNHFTVVAVTYQQVIGTPLKFTVTIEDSTGATVTTYAGTVHFTSSDSKAVLPADSPLTNGVGNFSATLNTSGNESITATDSSNAAISGNTGLLPVSGPATHLSVNGSGSAVTRSFKLVGVAPLDASNNYASSYNGTVHITSSDGAAILPADATLQASAGTFQITFETAGSQTVTATDTVTSSIKGTSGPITVTASSSPTITSGSPPNGVTGAAYGPTNTNYDLCRKDPQTQFFTCTPCVPDTFACGGGGYPACPRRGGFTQTCVETITTVGFQVTATGGLLPLKWSGASLPAGLTVVAGFAGSGLIKGAPAAGSAATYQAMITVTDSGNPPAPVTMTYPIVISNPPPPVVFPSLLPGATVNQPFTFTFGVESGTGLAPYSNWKESGTLPAGIAPLSAAGVLAGTPTMTGAFPIALTVQDSDGQVSAAQDFTLQVYAHGFKTTGSMATGRTLHTATLLGDGTVLVVGGYPGATTEIYNPASGTFTLTKGKLSVDLFRQTATLLANGKVLIAGGTDFLTGQPVATAELYDPATGLFTPTAHNMTVPRSNHTATAIAGGKVLLAGGFNGSADVATAETYDPATDSFTATTGPMSSPRAYHTATLLTNGKVLIAGSDDPTGPTLATAELFDPGTGSFSSTGSMAAERQNHTATLLTTGPNSGKVLIAGGADNISGAKATAELYDSGTGTFTATGSMAVQRYYHTATLLSDGTVLMVGGLNTNTVVELYDPTTGTFGGTGELQAWRYLQTATLLKDGSTVLVTGGNGNAGPGTAIATAELYQ